MESEVSKWGNSLAVRLPKKLAEEARLTEGGKVDVTIEDGRIIIARSRRYTLAELVERITLENRHDETSMGEAVGEEVW